jgi:hypothetical protein
MAVKVEDFSLSFRSSEDLVGVSFSPEEDELILTSARDGIKVLNIFDGRCVCSFLAPNGERFTSKALLHNGYVYSVLDGHSIFWIPKVSKDAVHVPKVKRLRETKGLVQNIFSSDKCRDLFVLYEDGGVDVFDATRTGMVYSFPPAEHRPSSILASELTHIRDGGVSGSAADVFIFSQESTAFTLDLISLSLLSASSPAKFAEKRFRCEGIRRPSQVKAPKGESGFISFHVSDRISILWVGGIWQVFQYRIVNDDLILEEQFLREISLFSSELSTEQESSKRKRKESSRHTSAPGSYFTFEHQNSFVGILNSQNEKCCVTIWDVNYGTVVGSHSFTRELSQEIVRFGYSKKKRNSAALVLSETVIVLPIHSTITSNLASALGSLKMSEPFLSPDCYKSLSTSPLSISSRMDKSLFYALGGIFLRLRVLFFPELFALEQAPSELFLKTLLERDGKERAVISKLLDASITPTSKEFSEILNEYLDSIRVQGNSSIFMVPSS